ncbi:MAG TPA: hypothetical protein VGN54_09980 [Mycobacteriales bacterium]|jgi:hypothetical protein|nr:hypothetical protein [Mycobacteriales bacterium]
MNKLKSVAVLAAAAPLALVFAGTASAQPGPQTFTSNLKPVPLNGQNNASGMLTLTLNGNVATIHEQVSGVAMTFMGAPFPHVQHIHGGAQGICPTAAADANHDGVISTSDGQPSYGAIQTTLSLAPGGTTAADGTNIKIAPSGSSFTYDRTITLDQTTLNSINSHIAVIVVHGLDPATAPKAAGTSKSEIPGTTALPLAATAPALCGALVASPTGAVATGGGGTAGLQDPALLALGGGLLLAAGGSVIVRRRAQRTSV